MSKERVIKILNQFGLSRLDAKVYIYLSKTGPQSKKEIVNALKIQLDDLNSCVTNLCSKGIVALSIGDPVILCAFPFEKVLEILIRNEIKTTKTVKEKGVALFSDFSTEKNLGKSNHE